MASESSSATGTKDTTADPPSTHLVWIRDATGKSTHSATMKINCTAKFCKGSICTVPVRRTNAGLWKSGACLSCNKRGKQCNLAGVSAETLDAYQAGRSKELPKAELCPERLARKKTAAQWLVTQTQQSAGQGSEESSSEAGNDMEISEIEELLSDRGLEAQIIDHQTNCQLATTGSCDECSTWWEMEQIFLGERGPIETFGPSSGIVPTRPNDSQVAQSGQGDMFMQDTAITSKASNAETKVWTSMGEALQNQQRRGPTLGEILRNRGLTHLI